MAADPAAIVGEACHLAKPLGRRVVTAATKRTITLQASGVRAIFDKAAGALAVFGDRNNVIVRASAQRLAGGH